MTRMLPLCAAGDATLYLAPCPHASSIVASLMDVSQIDGNQKRDQSPIVVLTE